MADKDFIIPKENEPVKIEAGILPKANPPVKLKASFDLNNKATTILKSVGLGLVKSRFYRVNVNEVQKANRERKEFEEQGGKFGLPIFDTLTFSGDGRASADGESTASDGSLTYTNFDDETVTLDPLRMDIVLLTVNQPKHIVRTAISGRNGRVKEYISDDDYTINVKGFFFGDYTDVEDRKNKLALIDYCKANVSINCSSGYLQDFDINSLVIDDYTFTQVEGERSKTMFELKCYSDVPFEIEETKDANNGQA